MNAQVSFQKKKFTPQERYKSDWTCVYVGRRCFIGNMAVFFVQVVKIKSLILDLFLVYSLLKFGLYVYSNCG